MIIDLNELRVVETVLEKDSIFYRAVNNQHYIFQPSDNSIVNPGRFNKSGQYCFYLASSDISAVLEIVSHYLDATPNVIYIKKIKLKKSLRLVDLIRWRYVDDSLDKEQFSLEHIMINQHIVCPNKSWATWLYRSSQKIADYYRLSFEGIRYQTSVAHFLQGSGEIFEHLPENLFNYAIYKNPEECEDMFELVGEEEKETEPLVRLFNNTISDDKIQLKIRACNVNELIAGVELGNTDYSPSLNIFDIVV